MLKSCHLFIHFIFIYIIFSKVHVNVSYFLQQKPNIFAPKEAVIIKFIIILHPLSFPNINEAAKVPLISEEFICKTDNSDF